MMSTFTAKPSSKKPWTHYAEMRALGPVVWLPGLGNYALTRFAEVRAALRDPEVFQSGEGVAGDDFGCSYLRGNTVAPDEPRHSALRGAMAPQLARKALEDVRPVIEDSAALYCLSPKADLNPV